MITRPRPGPQGLQRLGQGRSGLQAFIEGRHQPGHRSLAPLRPRIGHQED